MKWFKRKPEAPLPETAVDVPSLELPPLPELPPLHESSEIPSEADIPSIRMPELPPLPPVPEQEYTPAQEEREELPKPPVSFIEKNDFQELQLEIARMDTALKNSQAIMDSLVTIKTKADTHLEEWRATLEDMERKLLYMDKVLFES